MAGISPAWIEVKVVLARLLGAVLRATLVVVVVAVPSLMIPGTTEEGAQMVMLVALTLGVFIAFEYGATFPALIEFRDAPPFNRVRILALLSVLMCLSAMAGGDASGSSLVLVLNALGLMVGQGLDFPVSPIAVLLAHLPAGPSPLSATQVKAMAGMAVLIAAVALAVFGVALRLGQWPNRDQAFNVWVNLPTFDPTTGGDVVPRLKRDARVNLILGIGAACILPTVGLRVANQVDLAVLASPHTLVWGVALWMFLPLSMVMRGLAMARIADMIRDRRARLTAAVGGEVPLGA